jgi:hypothetical protein
LAVCGREFNPGKILGKFVAVGLEGAGGKKIGARNALFHNFEGLTARNDPL